MERGADGRLHNTSVHVSPDGEIRAVYRKIHMFDVTIDGIAYRESEHEDAPARRSCSRARTAVSSWE